MLHNLEESVMGCLVSLLFWMRQRNYFTII